MDSISIKLLSKCTTVIVKQVEQDDESVLVTREGRPAAYLVPIAAADKLGLEKQLGRQLTRSELLQRE